MRVRRLTIKNFRGVRNGIVDFPKHTLLVGGNNVGKSTICEALDLVLGPERLYRRPVVDEHDFYNSKYLDDEGNPIEIRIEVVLLELSKEAERRFFGRTRPWSDARSGFIDEDGAVPADADGDDVCRGLPVVFIGKYDREEDDFIGNTFFAHPVEEMSNDDEDDSYKKLGLGLTYFGRDHKRLCGFLFLRTLRTGRRALSLERGSLLDTILRIGDTGKDSMWQDTLDRLRGLEPGVGSIPQLAEIRRQIKDRMARFVGLAAGDDATIFFASELTREHLREVVRFFVCSQESDYPLPFHRLGTGAINTLVFALLTYIAELKGKQSVIFAMEEPEIALPPHTQRRITRFVLKEMGQAIVTSHSPYVIEEFGFDQILSISRKHGSLISKPVPLVDVKQKTLKREKRQLAEAILSHAVIVTEGAAESAMLPVASEMLENMLGSQSYVSFDLSGVSVFDAVGQTNVPKWGPFFASLGKKVFAFHDKENDSWSSDDLNKLSAYEINTQTNYSGLEKLLVEEIPVSVLRRFLSYVGKLPSYPRESGELQPNAKDVELKDLARRVLDKRKGEGYAAILLSHCKEVDDLPKSVTDFLLEVQKSLSSSVLSNIGQTTLSSGLADLKSQTGYDVVK